MIIYKCFFFKLLVLWYLIYKIFEFAYNNANETFILKNALYYCIQICQRVFHEAFSLRIVLYYIVHDIHKNRQMRDTACSIIAIMYSPQRNRKEWLCNICVVFYWPYGGDIFISTIIIGISLYSFHSLFTMLYCFSMTQDHYIRIR